MEGLQEQKIGGKSSDRTDELMDLLIRDPNSLCRDDLEKLCEAISRDALSTKTAIANGSRPPDLNYYNVCDSSSQLGSNYNLGTGAVRKLSLNGEQSNTVATPLPVINMASGDGLSQNSFSVAPTHSESVSADRLHHMGNEVHVTEVGSTRQGSNDLRRNHHQIEDTASNRVFAAINKNNFQSINAVQDNLKENSSTIHMTCLRTNADCAQNSRPVGFLVRSSNGIAITCPYERTYQVGESPATFYAMPARQMKYTVPCSEQAIATTNWLLENFEENMLSTMPRSAMYEAYVRRFKAHGKVKHFNQAVFGKMVRACFPNLTTRRLGVRGHSRYHYAGLGVRPTSKYVESLSVSSVASVSRTKNSTKKNNRLQLGVAANVTIDSSGIEKTTDMIQQLPKDDKAAESDMFDLPSSFPAVDDLVPHSNIDQSSLRMFLTFYSDYNGQLLSFMSSLDQEKTEEHLQRFGVLIPGECISLLQLPFVQDVVRLCDGILFAQAAASLLPHCMATLSTEFKVSLRRFARAFIEWISNVITVHNIPEEINKIRVAGAIQWADYVKRVTTLCHVAKEARKSLKDHAVTKQLRIDLETVPLDEICSICAWCSSENESSVSSRREATIAKRYMAVVLAMLKSRARLEEYVGFVDEIVNEQIYAMKGEKFEGFVSSVEQKFLMKWAMYSSKILTEITLKSSGSVGTFHLVSLLFGDYISHILRSMSARKELLQVARRVLRRPTDDKLEFSE